MTQTGPRIWLDTTTLFRTFRRGPARVTGIPRVVSECLRAARRDAHLRDRIRLCRASAASHGISPVSWDAFEALLAEADTAALPRPGLRDHLRRRLSPALVDRLAGMEEAARRLVGRARAPAPAQTPQHPFADNDIWINLGCWWHEDLPRLIGDVTRTTRLRTVVTIHDCMPLAFPEFFPREQVRLWQDGRDALQGSTDTILAVSENTGRDVRRYLPGFAGPVHPIRLGDTFQRRPDPAPDPATLATLGLTEPFVLVVGTIEARKNHILAFRTWRGLIRAGIDLPILVFAGRWGWKVADLAAEIADSRSLDGRLRVIEAPSDTELAALYKGALFTLFPSHYEGWGLPVRESLAFGRICIAARNSAIVEASAGLADEVDSNCQGALETAVRSYLDPATRAAREAVIARDFRPIGWDETWAQIRDRVDG